MTGTLKIALKKLAQDPKNVRKTYSDASIAELAASIADKGVIQNLIVRKGEKRGHYLVTAGERRRRALALLAEQKTICGDYEVECRVVEANEAEDYSLTENVMREQMNPADQLEAFLTLAQQGLTNAQIAARYGVSETIVKKRITLANVAPALLELFRKGDMDLSQLQAFTITDDHETQIRVWNELPPTTSRAAKSAVR